MTGDNLRHLRKDRLGMTQAEFARALEVSPVTVNRWENVDPRYEPSAKEVRLMEALAEIISNNDNATARKELRDVLLVTSVAGLVAKAAVGRVLSVGTIALLAATPGLGWLGVIAGIGVGAALPFFTRMIAHREEGHSDEAKKTNSASSKISGGIENTERPFRVIKLRS